MRYDISSARKRNQTTEIQLIKIQEDRMLVAIHSYARAAMQNSTHNHDTVIGAERSNKLTPTFPFHFVFRHASFNEHTADTFYHSSRTAAEEGFVVERTQMLE